jgi:hypothetical protein
LNSADITGNKELNLLYVVLSQLVEKCFSHIHSHALKMEQSRPSLEEVSEAFGSSCAIQEDCSDNCRNDIQHPTSIFKNLNTKACPVVLFSLLPYSFK